MFVDTSAVVALLADEPEAARLASTLAGAKLRYSSGLVILEAVARLSVLLDLDPVLAETHVQMMFDEAAIIVVPINANIAGKAVAAFAAYGQGTGHPAQLSLADCMSYACARAYRVPLLCLGGGFWHTDIKIA